MKLLYVIAWVVIIGFLIWSGNLLLEIQSMESETDELHQLSLHLDSLAGAWLDLNRPGNDVLENYEVEEQRSLFDRYKQHYLTIHAAVQQRLQGDNTLLQPMSDLKTVHDSLVKHAGQVISLAEQREFLRQAQASAELVSKKETAAATAMAHMDQEFQKGLDMIHRARAVVIERVRGLEAQNSENFQRLYVMLLVTLIVSAHSLVMIRQSMRQRAALQDTTARINTIVNNIVDGIITVDSNGSIESINQSAERMFGYKTSQILGKDFIQLLEKCCQNLYLDQLENDSSKRVNHTILTDECDGLGKRQDGSTFPIELASNQVTVKGQKLLIHIVRDITDRKKADQTMRLAASVFEHATEGIVVTDVNGTIQSVNPAYMAITQYPEDELIGDNPRLLQSHKQDREFYEQMWGTILSSGHWEGEIWNRRKNGEIFPQWLSINAIKDDRGRTTNYIGVAWDISELKASQQIKEEFITTISHELRTPLTSVLVSLGMLSGGMGEILPDQARKLVLLAHSNSKRLVRLIDDILDMEKIEAGRMTFRFEPLHLGTLAKRVVEDCKALAKQADVSITCRILNTDAYVNGDSDRLMQAVTNLLSNAIKFSPSGNSVEVVVKSHASMHRIEVTDHGPGIPGEFRKDIFKRFAQANKIRRQGETGTGLGLSITKLIVQQHGGEVDFWSIPGLRTTFYIDLPRAEQINIVTTASNLN